MSEARAADGWKFSVVRHKKKRCLRSGGCALIWIESRLGQFVFELFKDGLTGFCDGDAPEGGFPVVMERCAWRESHHGASAASEDDRGFFGFPAIGAAIRAGIIGLVKVLGFLADFDDIGEGFFVKAPIGIRVQFPVRVRVTDHRSAA
jgi:hypothetical protein